jgi:hypothetical protein
MFPTKVNTVNGCGFMQEPRLALPDAVMNLRVPQQREKYELPELRSASHGVTKGWARSSNTAQHAYRILVKKLLQYREDERRSDSNCRIRW